MIHTRSLATATLLAAAASAFGQTVTVSLTSAQNGQTVAPAATINWQIAFTDSAGNNAGLALLVADLMQDPTNPALLNIPQAASVPAPMSNFSRPAGISNPGEGANLTTGYVGVQRGTVGAKNLIQIGGGQNTFGIANTPGSGIGESANVVGGRGQSGSVVLASGAFPAPAANGVYTFSLTNVLANTLDSVSTPPAFSPVSSASVIVAAPSFSFTVGATCAGNRGDANCSGGVDFFDIDPFLLALFDLPQYQANFCGGSICAADVDCSTAVDFFDIDPFLLCLFSGCAPCP